MKALVFKKFHFYSNNAQQTPGLAQWLLRIPLISRESRVRSAFIKQIEPHLNAIDEGVAEIVDRHTAKEDGKTVFLDKNSKETTDPALGIRKQMVNQAAANKEVQEFLEEDLIIDITPANYGTLLSVQGILLNSREEFSGQLAILYDEWCRVFESAPLDNNFA